MTLSIDVQSLESLQGEINTQVENVIQSNFKLFSVWTGRIEETKSKSCNDKDTKIRLSIKRVDGRKATIDFCPSDNARLIHCIIKAIQSPLASMDDVSKQFFEAIIING